ncbi:MAG: biotin--[acetyl-CoA-carboxylase] ligase [Myxococcales bacterium]|nr:biotin--[acetyl-CoA-carboxylase] ligase [Myxococcales bacterium]
MTIEGLALPPDTSLWLAAQLPSIDSTNSHLYQWALREQLSEGALVVADAQSAGRGRRQRRWISPKGGLYLSLLLRPTIAPAAVSAITQLAAVALYRAVSSLVGADELQLKWPNDLLYRGRKVAGILCELAANGDRLDFVVVGIGVNCRESDLPGELEAIATTLPFARGELFTALVRELEASYRDFGQRGIGALAGYPRLLRIVGRRIRIEDGEERVEGVVARLGPTGTLILALDDGDERECCTGDVTLLD